MGVFHTSMQNPEWLMSTRRVSSRLTSAAVDPGTVLRLPSRRSSGFPSRAVSKSTRDDPFPSCTR